MADILTEFLATLGLPEDWQRNASEKLIEQLAEHGYGDVVEARAAASLETLQGVVGTLELARDRLEQHGVGETIRQGHSQALNQITHLTGECDLWFKLGPGCFHNIHQYVGGKKHNNA